MRRARTSAMQRDEGGRHLSKRKQLFLGCPYATPLPPAPPPLLQIFNETFFRKLFSSLRKSRTRRFESRVVSYSRAEAVAREMLP